MTFHIPDINKSLAKPPIKKKSSKDLDFCQYQNNEIGQWEDYDQTDLYYQKPYETIKSLINYDIEDSNRINYSYLENQ